MLESAFNNLGDENPEIRKDAIHDMCGFSDNPSIIPLLIDALNDENPIARASAAKVVMYSELWSEEIELALTGLLSDVDEDVRTYAAVVLASRHSLDEEHIGLIIRALNPQNEDEYAASHIAGHYIETVDVIPARYASDLIDAYLNSKSSCVSFGAIHALKHLDGDISEVINLLIAAVETADETKAAYLVACFSAYGEAAVPAVPLLIEGSNGPSRILQGNSISALGKIGKAHEKVVPRLLHLLSYKEDHVVNMAAHALAEIGEEAFPEFAEAARKGRWGVYKVFGKMGNDALPLLIELLDSEIQSAHDMAERALKGILRGQVNVNPDYLEEMEISPELRQRFEAIMNGESDPGYTAVLEKLRKSSDPDGSFQASKTLLYSGEFKGDPVPIICEDIRRSITAGEGPDWEKIFGLGMEFNGFVPQVLNVLGADDVTYDGGFMVAFGTAAARRHEELVPVLDDLMASTNPYIRKIATGFFAELYDEYEIARELLSSALDDPDPDVRKTAVGWLHTLGPDAIDAVDSLFKALNDEDDEIVLAVLDALVNIHPDSTEMVSHFLSETDGRLAVSTRANELSERIIRDIKANNKDEYIQMLIPLSEDKCPAVRLFAVKNLISNLGKSREVVAVITRSLTDTNAEVRSYTVISFDYRWEGAEQAIPALTKLIFDNNTDIAEHAVVKLGHFGPAASEAIPSLERLLKETSDERIKTYAERTIELIKK